MKYTDPFIHVARATQKIVSDYDLFHDVLIVLLNLLN